MTARHPAAKTPASDRSRKPGQGSKWIRPTTRLAIYLRDGMACAYCGRTIEDGMVATLDHLTPSAKGGSNRATNLVTACRACNSARQTTPLAAWCRQVAETHGTDSEVVYRHVRACARRVLPRAAAAELRAARNTVTRRCYGA